MVSATTGMPEACAATIRSTSETKPDAENQAVYARYYPMYRSLYPALKNAFADVSRLSQP